MNSIRHMARIIVALMIVPILLGFLYVLGYAFQFQGLSTGLLFICLLGIYFHQKKLEKKLEALHEKINLLSEDKQS